MFITTAGIVSVNKSIHHTIHFSALHLTATDVIALYSALNYTCTLIFEVKDALRHLHFCFALGITGNAACLLISFLSLYIDA